MNLKRIKPTVAILWLLCASIALSAAGQNTATTANEPRPAPTPAEIGEWISKLDDDRYLVREQATQQLIEAGSAALDPLLAAADAERPEPSDRSIWILRRQSTAKDLTLRRQALVRLVSLKKRPQVAAAAREQLAVIEHEAAVQAIEKLGGRYIGYGEFVPQLGSNFAPGVILDERWRGGDAGLEHLRHLVALRNVLVIGTDLSLDGLKELQHCESLRGLLLYSTKLEPDDAEKLRKLLTDAVQIDFRRSLLGVASNPGDGTGPAIVSAVTPGSAAAAAGVQVNDLIQKLNGEPIPSFKTLTLKIGAHHPGEEITLGVLRNGQPIDLKVKLGKWKLNDID